MRELGDFYPGQLVTVRFNTHLPDGTPLSLAGSPELSVYKTGSAAQTTAGVTLTVDYDGLTGLNYAEVATASDPGFYAAGADYDVVITAGTVDGTSVAGTVVATFSLANRTDVALPVEPPYGRPPDTTTGVPGSPLYVDVPTTNLYGDPLYGKPRGVRLDQGSPARLRLPLRSQATGGPLVVTLNPYGGGAGVLVRYREATGVSPCVYVPDGDDVGVVTADGTAADVPVPVEVKDHPGVYEAQVLVYDASGTERARDAFWVYVDRGLFLSGGGAPANNCGAPTVAELRTALRDHPGANRLLGDFEFDPAELGQAVVAAVQAFNTEFPPLPRPFTTRTFPANGRRPLIDGALAYLFETAATYHRRGMLPYQASGLTVNDLAKEKDYLGAAQLYRERFNRWSKLVRASISIAAGWGSLGSTPGYWGAP